MSRHRRQPFLLVVLPAACLAVWPTDRAAAQTTAGHKKLGALSCSAAACHGSVTRDPRPGNIWRNEYIHWFENDPHARAADVLTNRRSQVMLQKLGIRADASDAGYQNCLRCHDPSPPSGLQGPNYYTGFGVDCETCHGHAEDWIATHYQPGFSRGSAGMIDTKSLMARAELCAECHVGAAGQQVNHDLIAAGHPPLKFELAAYLDLLPKHWDDGEERRTDANFETRLWLAGQVASTRAALQSLSTAAQQANDEVDAAWPEFSHFDCYACHHDLLSPSWRQQRGYDNRPPGSLPTNRWQLGLLPLMQPASANESMAAFTAAADRLQEVMERSLRPEPDDVIEASENAIAALDEAFPDARQVATDRDLPTELIDAIGASGGDASAELAAKLTANWDVAAQTYLMLVAIHQTHRDRGSSSAEVGDTLNSLRKRLAFPPGYDSPKYFAASATDDSAANTIDELRSDIVKILSVLDGR